MAKQNKSRKSENVVGKGKLTTVQVAFLVDRYLFDNHYNQTRSIFRSEVSSLLSKSSVQEAPESLLSLSAILDEYIRFKEQRVFMDQEKVQLDQARVHLEQECIRVQNLLQGMQDAMNVYNRGVNASSVPPALPSAGDVHPRLDLSASSKAGHNPVYNPSVAISTSCALATNTDNARFSTPVTNQPTISKRNGVTDLYPSHIAKRSRTSSTTNQMPIRGGAEVSTHNDSAGRQFIDHGNTSNAPLLQGSTAVKCLINQTTKSCPANSSCPKTPPRSSSSQYEKAASPVVICSRDMTPRQITSTNSTIISSQTIQISPVKQISYCSIERNHSISMSSPSNTKRDHIKGRLNFDAPDMPPSSLNPISDMGSTPKPGLDLDIPNLDSFGEDFNIFDLLHDFDLQNEGSDCSIKSAGDSSPDSHSGSSYTNREANYGANQVLSHKVDELFSEDTDMPGPGCVTTIKSMTKRIKMLSPVKGQIEGSMY